MKPRAKVVTAQDVESSLFYCHVDSPDDQGIREALQSDDESQELSEGVSDSQIHRPSQVDAFQPEHTFRDSELEFGDRPELPPRSVPEIRSIDPFGTGDIVNQQGIRRKPVGSNQPKPQFNKPAARPPSPPKLHGPRPLKSNCRLHEGIVFRETESGKESINPRRWSEQPPPLPPRTDTRLDRNSFENVARRGGNNQSNITQSSEMDHQELSITLIRRDPASGGQWNVGKIAMGSRQSSQLVGSGLNMPGDDARGILLEIANPGYDKFSHYGWKDGEKTMNIRQNQYVPFQRWLHLSRSKQQSQAPTTRRSGFRSSIDFHRRSSGPSLSKPQNPTTPHQDMFRPFSFQSPWDGLCEFSTGAAGRSLKCKHSLANLASNVQTNPNGPGFASTVSELRFNLPSNNVVASKARRPLPDTAASSRSSFPSSRIGHGRSSSYDSGIGDEDIESYWDGIDQPMDLSLGQERAGGGFTGKKAKLGKLIIENEGIQMLDLVVAANMGFWWNVTKE